MAYDSTNVEQLKYSRRKTMSKDYNDGWALTLLFYCFETFTIKYVHRRKNSEMKTLCENFHTNKEVTQNYNSYRYILLLLITFYSCWQIAGSCFFAFPNCCHFAAVAVPTISTISRFYCFLAISSWVLMESPTNLIYFIVLIPTSGRWQQDERKNRKRQ